MATGAIAFIMGFTASLMTVCTRFRPAASEGRFETFVGASLPVSTLVRSHWTAVRGLAARSSPTHARDRGASSAPNPETRVQTSRDATGDGVPGVGDSERGRAD
ncbi:BZ3500_MvSof-1268-A1-R1_Chr10-1g02700 [Microbotryum saponariae]|uniref:BZ3500_MvSof-1268-A1-R1_Chr10-1g02699 protein n=1 Tax=Microbotryum saponariae TaxID=289078 RepID=A0A2X0LJZ1_9BASI|nr:BZ3500_MvSof-1268-A1-R1_Chr10-1g02699 [Microbotryum saponariae]SDA01472.1 BZ3500_MvSof-1268-A1-R1_Chr10-1g02700 [Microbotryum saponariae]SDA06188.1 BZ3501_MvSof-1269-A2-R1_Chr10-1g02300 [Microbotryum saponariae]SDA06189.1 BZ3501_MvSof-1269-A2-R1_Chr10-1g02301 [Microbotryum saponariae]